MSTSHISSSASISGKKVFLSIANQTPDTEIETRIVLRDAVISNVVGRILYDEKANATNSFTEPKRVVPRKIKPEVRKSEVILVLPAHAFAVLSITLGG